MTSAKRPRGLRDAMADSDIVSASKGAKRKLSPAAQKQLADKREQEKAAKTLGEVQGVLDQWENGLITGVEADNKLVMLRLQTH